MANLCRWTIGRRIHARTRAIRVAAVAIVQIAVIANFTTFELSVATNGRGTRATFANLPHSARRTIGKRAAAGMSRIVARSGDTRIEIRAITRRIVRQTRKFASVTTVAINDVTIFAFFRNTHEKIATLILTTDSSNADLTIGACRTIGRRFSFGARMIVLARLRAITWIRIVAFDIARRGTFVIAGEVAIGFATITTHHITVVTRFQSVDFAIVVAGTGSAPSAHASHIHSTSAAFARFAPSSFDGDIITAATSRKNSRCSKSYDRHKGRKYA